MFLLSYTLGMLVAELLCDSVSVATFVFLKHILPYTVTISVPLAILATLEDVREETKVTPPAFPPSQGCLRPPCGGAGA